jgi:squalene-hopene/tetraprenyl-beta-curcumene cyclase
MRLFAVIASAALLVSFAGNAWAAESAPSAPAPEAKAVPVATATAETKAVDTSKPLADRRKEAIARGVAAMYKAQGEDGSWGMPKGSVGVTALCVDGLLEAGQTIKEPGIKKALDFILKAQKDDGGIYDDEGLKVYSTSIALMALVRADKAAYTEQIKKATKWLEGTQWGSDESIEKTDLKYGGFGYGKSNRPDLSNTQFALRSLKEAGVAPDSPIWTRAIVFLSRCQDNSETNDKAFKGTDNGGAIYSPVESKSDMITLPDGSKVMKTYGSMTYALLQSFVFANMKADDPRMKAAVEWIRKHWTFEENPEMGQQGLFYSYLTAAKALSAYSQLTKESTITDAARRPHDWKAELTEAILKRQKADGMWTNEADRWFEGYAPVPTSYALMALAACE